VPGSSADDAGVNTPRWVRVIELLKTLPMIAFFVACQSGTVTTPPTVPPSTQVSVFAPYGSETLNGDITVSETVKGSCWEQSIVTSRPDAFRCVTGNNLLEDPCFMNTYPTRAREVVCPSVENPNEVLRIQLTKPLPATFGGGLAVSTKSPPFWIVLTDGTTCIQLSGTAPSIGGLRVNYTCTGAESSLIGDIDRTQPMWTSEATVKDQSALVTVQLAKVYV